MRNLFRNVTAAAAIMLAAVSASYGQSAGSFFSYGNVTLSGVDTAGANVALPTAPGTTSVPPTMRVCNRGSSDGYYKFGTSNAVSASTSSFMGIIEATPAGAPPNCRYIQTKPASVQYSWVAFVTASGSTDIYIEGGVGGLADAHGGGGGGGGGGTNGTNGWSPIFALVQDDGSSPYRVVQQVVGWTGGTGTPPANGKYVGPTGLVTTAAAAVDVRGGAGSNGSNGAAATIAVGTVSTLSPGASATVTNSGTSSSAVINFGIPRGDVGATGSAATVAVGTVSTLSPGSSATVTNSGTSSAAVINFGIPAGVAGTNGVDGKTILATSGAPSSGTGANGDIAYDATTQTIYGPKSGGSWPAGVVLKGTDGTNGTNGSTVLTTSGAPSSGTGANGDYAYDPAAQTIYGPKASGSWPAGIVLTGSAGATGWSPILAAVQDNGSSPYRVVLEVIDWTGGTGSKPATGQYIGPTGLVSTLAAGVDIRGGSGAAGTGVPTGGSTGQVLAKNSATNYDTGWVTQSGGRTALTSDTTFYVRTDGSDSNTCTANTSGGACLTLQGMYNKLLRGYDLAGYTATAQIGAGTYTAGLLATAPVPGGLVIFQGDTTTPSNVVISTSGTNAFEVTNGVGNVTLKGVKVTTASSGSGVRASNGAQINIYNIEFGTCVTYQIRADYGGQVLPQTNYTISGGASAHWFVGQGGGITVATKTITVTGTPAFGTAFAVAQNLSFMAVTGNTYSGSATGVRYNITGNSIVNTGGQATTAFPGGTIGTTANGGLYF